MTTAPRPRPLLEKLKTVGGALAALNGLVVWAASFGLLTEQQSAATSATIALVPGVITTIGTLLSSFGVIKSGEQLVTPVEAPQDNAGRVLVPLDGPTRSRDIPSQR